MPLVMWSVAGRNVRRKRPERVERRLVAPFQLLAMFSSIMCIGTWPGPSFITCRRVPTRAWSVRLDLEFAELRLVIRIRNRAGAQAVADAERHSYCAMRSQMSSSACRGNLLMMRQAPLGHDAAAARDDARHALRRHRT